MCEFMKKGLEISKAYFEEYGRPMLEEQFPEVLPYLAAGLMGSGSECFGFDDEVSRDHDFEPGFCLFLPGEDVVDRRTAFLLERAYAKLPKEFGGLKRSLMQPVGGPRHGVLRTEEFFRERLGEGLCRDLRRAAEDRADSDAPERRTDTAESSGEYKAWLALPEQSLAEAVNGEIFFDHYGEVSRIRRGAAFYPEDVRRKKLAGYLLLMAQAGQYNYTRCLAHGETAAAQLAVCEFVKSACGSIFLLNKVYQPYYKWTFRALRALPLLFEEAELLEYLLTTDNAPETAEEKYGVIEGIAADVIEVLTDQGLTEADCGDLEKHAYSVNDGIADGELRNLHILAGVS